MTARVDAVRMLNAAVTGRDRELTESDLTDRRFVAMLLHLSRTMRASALVRSGWVETPDSEEEGRLARALSAVLGGAS